MASTLEEYFKSIGLSRVASELVQHAHPSIRVFSDPAHDDQIGIGTSKLGGSPDVPDDFVWPRWNELPQRFIGQFALSDLCQFPCSSILPRSGVLSFFYDSKQTTWGYDSKEKGGWSVYYFTSELARRAHPTEELLEPRSFPARVFMPPLRISSAPTTPCSVRFSEELTLANPEQLNRLGLKLTSEEEKVYRADPMLDNVDSHHLLGHPIEENVHDMQLCCEMITNGIAYSRRLREFEKPDSGLRARASRWRLLAQFERSDTDAGLLWSEADRLTFWITEEELARASFSEVWMLADCW